MRKPFHVLLSDDERQALESYRAANGLKSEGDAIRHLISSGEVAHAVSRPAAKEIQRRANAEFSAAVESMPVAEKSPVFQTRLKGEWKPK